MIDEIDKIIFISTWNIGCGIATYTKYLSEELNKLYPKLFMVDPINQGALDHYINGKLVHLQHEFGIVPELPNTDNKVIITWHSVYKPQYAVYKLESRLNAVAHIVHCEDASKCIDTLSDIYVIDHGSALIPEMKKEDARKILGINNVNKPIGFIFGFQSANKKYDEIINAAKNTNIHIIVSGAKHESGYKTNLSNSDNITFIDRCLTEKDVNLYALASDLLLFDYVGQDHYSCSGAMHRTIGAGRPVVCSNTKHFSDLTDGRNALKFNNQEELEECIEFALANPKKFGRAARAYAKETSWNNVAKKHLEIYSHYVDI